MILSSVYPWAGHPADVGAESDAYSHSPYAPQCLLTLTAQQANMSPMNGS